MEVRIKNLKHIKIIKDEHENAGNFEKVVQMKDEMWAIFCSSKFDVVCKLDF